MIRSINNLHLKDSSEQVQSMFSDSINLFKNHRSGTPSSPSYLSKLFPTSPKRSFSIFLTHFSSCSLTSFSDHSSRCASWYSHPSTPTKHGKPQLFSAPTADISATRSANTSRAARRDGCSPRGASRPSASPPSPAWLYNYYRRDGCLWRSSTSAPPPPSLSESPAIHMLSRFTSRSTTPIFYYIWCLYLFIFAPCTPLTPKLSFHIDSFSSDCLIFTWKRATIDWSAYQFITCVRRLLVCYQTTEFYRYNGKFFSKTFFVSDIILQ